MSYIAITEEPLMSTAELCDKLGVTRQAIYKWRNLTDNPMPVAIDNTGLKGKTIRYLFSDVVEWLNGTNREGKVLRKKED
jgi:predicted DNA-binding transcriptional regulator AlpA